MNDRYQRGQQIPIVLGLPGRADGLPYVLITDPSESPFGEAMMVPYIPGHLVSSFLYKTFIRLPGGAALGTYTVSFTYTIAGVPGTQASEFDVVEGGDSGGEVIAMFDYDRPEARYLLVQLATGKLVQGRNPHL